MKEFKQKAHLYLGISKAEFERRLKLGIIDCELLKSQIDQSSLETKLESECEKLLEMNEQVDKLSVVE